MPWRILHLEDNPVDAELVRSLLASEKFDCALSCVQTKEAYEAALANDAFDLILSDYSLPHFDGLAALDIARQRHPETPVIVVSGTMDEETAVESLKRGAADYVFKDRLSRLPSAIRRAMTAAEEATRHQQAEETIREQAALLDMAKDAILVRNLEERILYWNKSAERLYGWSAAEALGQNANELLYQGDSLKLEQARQQVLERGDWVGELQQVNREGQPLTVESRWSLVRDPAGQPKANLIINTDITERKKLEAQFLRIQRLETIGALTGGIAHDLNNLLAPILIGTQLLGDKLAGEEGQKILGTIRASALRGSEMIKQILAFARGVGGGVVVVDLKQLLAEVGRLVRGTFLRAVRIQINIAESLYSVLGNATQLHQVLLNLCVNARDAMPRGGVLSLEASNITLDGKVTRLQPEPASGPYVMVTVSDTGQGISPELMDKIFEPFFTTKAPGKGTGLGLSTVLGIVKSHGGFLDVASEVGKGTTFQVYLPAHLPTEPAPA